MVSLWDTAREQLGYAVICASVLVLVSERFVKKG
jgi:hypothetical protein